MTLDIKHLLFLAFSVLFFSNCTQKSSILSSLTSGGSTAASSGTPTAPGTPPSNASPPTTPAVEYFGRFDFSDPAGPKFNWSGSSMRARFSGTSVSATLTGSSEWYVSTIDGVANRFLTGWGQQTYVLGSNLTAGVHTVVLTKDNEAGNGDTTTQFFGFTFGGGQLLPPLTSSYLRLEFVGDSITCAAWNLGINNSCPSSSAPYSSYLQVESASSSYAQQTANLLSAPPATNVCYSGRGLVSNDDGSTSGTLPSMYPYVEEGSSTPYSFSTNPQANVVVINLGTNDWTGSPSLQSGSTTSAAYKAFIAGYEAFIATIRKNYPSAQIICATGPLNAYSNYLTAVQTVVNFENASGDSKVHYFAFSPPLGTCNGHPTVPTDTAMAQQLSTFIGTLQ